MRAFIISIILITAFFLNSLPAAYCVPPTAFADVAEVDSTFGGGLASVSIVADVPSSTPSQLLVAVIYISHTTSSNPVLTPPDGWTSLGKVAGTYQFQEAFYRIGNGLVSATWAASDGVTKYTYRIANYANVDLVSPVNAFGGVNSNFSQFHFTPSVTTTVANCYLIAVWGSGDSRITFTPTATMTSLVNAPGSADGNALAISAVKQTAIGSTGQKQATASESCFGTNFIFALAPATAPPASSKRRRPAIFSE